MTPFFHPLTITNAFDGARIEIGGWFRVPGDRPQQLIALGPPTVQEYREVGKAHWRATVKTIEGKLIRGPLAPRLFGLWGVIPT